MELILDYNLDFVVVTIIWLTNNQSVNIWLEGTCINKDHLKMLTNNRVGQKEVALHLFIKKDIQLKQQKMAPSHHFNIQSGLWKQGTST